jgi:hypothetical protein
MKEIEVTMTSKGLASLIADKIEREGHEVLINEVILALAEWDYLKGVK